MCLMMMIYVLNWHRYAGDFGLRERDGVGVGWGGGVFIPSLFFLSLLFFVLLVFV